jgi:Kef-type K+ transport system membrane component KefB
MSESIQLFFALGVLITTAKTLGYVATRFSQPAVLGELIAGVMVGPSVIHLLHVAALFPDGTSVEHTVIEFAEIGVVLLMFSAGLEVDLSGLAQVGRTGLAAGTLGVIVPIMIAAPSALLFGYPGETAVFIGLILAATSVSISAQVMLELGVLRSVKVWHCSLARLSMMCWSSCSCLYSLPFARVKQPRADRSPKSSYASLVF